jgi:hypothetical protein
MTVFRNDHCFIPIFNSEVSGWGKVVKITGRGGNSQITAQFFEKIDRRMGKGSFSFIHVKPSGRQNRHLKQYLPENPA